VLKACLRTALFLLALFLAACVAYGPAFVPAAPPADDRALVYMYREDSQVGNVVGVTISVDGDETATLYRRGYTRFYAKPGKRAISVKLGFNAPHVYQVDLKGGDTRYFRLGTSQPRGGAVLEFTPVISGVGEREVVFYRFQEPIRQAF
jgi:hypothetical protein